MREDILKKYATLVVRVGINLQPSQPLVIRAPIACVDFVRALSAEAFAAGAYDVAVHWSDEELEHIRYQNAPPERFEAFPAWRKLFYDDHAARGAAFISIAAHDPDIFSDIDPEKLTAANISAGKALADYRGRLMSNRNTWCVVAMPTPAWARKVFPGITEEAATARLWDEILSSVRITQDNDPVAVWKEHIDTLQKRAEFLNQCDFAELHYTNRLGTDLRVELPAGHLWMGGAERSADGVLFAANMPTEEVYTLPRRGGVHGTVAASKPLHFNGNVIYDFKLTFRDGKVIDYTASRGADHLKELIETDEGASFLGEVALVPYDSPISRSNILFYNTLFDENASCHLAFGKAYPTCLKGGEDMTADELRRAGVNDSIVHEDFMIGTDDLSVVGRTRAGKTVQVMRQGNFVF
jgi:hypothetical protein